MRSEDPHGGPRRSPEASRLRAAHQKSRKNRGPRNDKSEPPSVPRKSEKNRFFDDSSADSGKKWGKTECARYNVFNQKIHLLKGPPGVLDREGVRFRDSEVLRRSQATYGDT